MLQYSMNAILYVYHHESNHLINFDFSTLFTNEFKHKDLNKNYILLKFSFSSLCTYIHVRILPGTKKVTHQH